MIKRSRSDTVQLKARMKEPLRAKLEGAAAAKGISLNAEMVHRLEQSFQRERAQQELSQTVKNAFYEEFGGLEYSPLLAMLGNAIRMVEAGTGQKWHQDFETAAQVNEAVTTIIGAFSPKAKKPAENVFPGLRGMEIGEKILRLAQKVGLSKSTPSKQE